MSEDNLEPIRNPEEVLDRFAEAWAMRSGEAIASLFVMDPEFVNVTGMWWHTRERIAMAHDFGFEKIFANSDLQFVDQRVRYIGDDAAVVHGQWIVIDQSAGDGTPAEPRGGIFVFVMEKNPEGWKAVAAQNTDIVTGHESIAVIDGQSVPQAYAGSPTSRGL